MTNSITQPLPEGFAWNSDARGRFAVRADLEPAFAAAGFGLAGDGAARPSALSGRTALLELELEGRRYLVRRFVHGGLLRWLTGARFFEPQRPFHELGLAHELSRRGIDTPPLVAARALVAGAGTWRLDVVTERVDDTLDVAHALVRAGLDRGTLARLLVGAGRWVRQLHDQGLLHADLTPRNVLVDGAFLRRESPTPRLWVLDLDRSVLRPALEPAERRRNLRRLYRHVARWSRQGLLHLSRAQLARFLAGYEPDRAPRQELWRAIERAHAKTVALHRAGWALEQKLARQRRDPSKA